MISTFKIRQVGKFGLSIALLFLNLSALPTATCSTGVDASGCCTMVPASSHQKSLPGQTSVSAIKHCACPVASAATPSPADQAASNSVGKIITSAKLILLPNSEIYSSSPFFHVSNSSPPLVHSPNDRLSLLQIFLI